MIARYLLLIAAASLTGCAMPPYGPLVFVSTHIGGLDVQASSSSGTPGMTFGYKSVNLAVVPTQREVGNGAGAPLFGCFDKNEGGPEKYTCTKERSLGAAGQDQKDPAGDAKSGDAKPADTEGAAANGRAAQSETFGDSVRDSLSVFASFNMKGTAQSPSVGVGEIFATGSAAVLVAEGVGSEVRYEGYAKQNEAAADCFKQAVAAKDAAGNIPKCPGQK